MTTKFYLDTRGVKEGTAPIKVSLSSKGSTTYIPTNISVLPEQWDKHTEKVIAHPQKAQLNTLLAQRKLDIDNALYTLQHSGRLHGLTTSEIKAKLTDYLNPARDGDLLLPWIEDYAAKQLKDSTKYLYTLTAKKVREFSNCASTLHFEDITQRWLEQFDLWMMRNGSPKKNARNVHFRNLRAVFNDARDEGVTACYPFRKFKIRPEPTQSRALSVEQIQTLFDADLGRHKIYADMFRLSFYLCGISFCDLCALTKDNIVNGRVEYKRQKTGQFVSVRLTPEAVTIIDTWHGEKHLVCISERYKDTKGFLKRMRIYLRQVGQTYDRKKKEWVGDSVAPKVSQYWTRHSFGTLGAELGHSEDAIASALGHHTNSVTSVYIRTFRNNQVDKAQRDVIDCIQKVNPLE